MAELIKAGKLPHPDAMTVNGKTIGENCTDEFSIDPRVILPFEQPLKSKAGFLHLKGTLFDSAIMKTSVISPAFSEQYLQNPGDEMAFEGPVSVFDGPEDYHNTLEERQDINAGTILIMRGAGPQGYPGAAEVVNMVPPGRLIREGIEVSVPPSYQHRQVRGLMASFRALEMGDRVGLAALLPSSTLRLKQRRAAISLTSKTGISSGLTSRSAARTSRSRRKSSRSAKPKPVPTRCLPVRLLGRSSSARTWGN